MRFLAAVSVPFLLVLVSAGPVDGREERGVLFLFCPGQVEPELASLLETVAPEGLPGGVCNQVITGVMPGTTFTLEPADPDDRLMVGTASSCPGPRAPDDYDNGTPLEGTPADRTADRLRFWLDDPHSNVWLVCNNGPQFEIHFTSGDYTNGPGDESGVVPGDPASCADGSCWAIVLLESGGRWPPGPAEYVYRDGA